MSDELRTEEFTGEVDRVIFNNPDNGYTVARLRDSNFRFITITGSFHSLNAGDRLKVNGVWKTHYRFGEQLSVEKYEFMEPDSLEGIEKYLASGLIEGIGKVLASKIVKRFGADTLRILDENISRLNEISRLGKKKIEQIRRSWDEQRDLRDAMIFLQLHGVSPAIALKIFKLYGKETVSFIKFNPYILINDISGIGFPTADKIACSLGIQADSDIRLEAGIIYMLTSLSDDGHVYYPYEDFVRYCSRQLNAGHFDIESAIYSLQQKGRIIVSDIEQENETAGESRYTDYTGYEYFPPFEEQKNGKTAAEFSGKGVFLSALYYAEENIASRIREIMRTRGNLPIEGRERMIEEVKKAASIVFAQEQINAVRASLNNKILIITGGPGTGKTTILNAILTIYNSYEMKVLLAAPTGRAAKKMTEATGYEAKTIHRLLEYSPVERIFNIDEDNPLKADLVVIDEASMVDTYLFHSLLRAIPSGAALILVGDVDQLPSIGPGNILRDLIDSGEVPTIRLNEIYRQSAESHIIVNAHLINKGELPELNHADNSKTDFLFYRIPEPLKAKESILRLCTDILPERLGYDPFSQIQVITPMHKGLTGTINLNSELQSVLNNSEIEINFMGRVLKQGDKVMQTRNNYQKDVFNGDIGKVEYILQKEKEVTVNFDGRMIKYEYPELEELSLAYAISVHKSQGSEYPVVIIPLMGEHYRMLQRNLLYTAITRGKEMVILLSTEKTVETAINNNRSVNRFTCLKQKLR